MYFHLVKKFVEVTPWTGQVSSWGPNDTAMVGNRANPAALASNVVPGRLGANVAGSSLLPGGSGPEPARRYVLFGLRVF